MKYLAMIQARCGSKRLANKVLKNLCGKPSLERMIERVKRSRKVDEVIVVTSIEKENLAILSLCSKLDVRVGVGAEEDVLDRFYQTAKLINPDCIIRLTADCPCFDAELLDLAIEELDDSSDYCGMMTESFADGLDFEIVRFSALKKAWEEANLKSEREHVTPYINKHPDIFKLQNFESPIGNFGDYRWAVDQPEDFDVVETIYSHFLNTEIGAEFGYRDILDFVRTNPQISNINKKYARNEGYIKSLQEDCILSNRNE